MFSEKHYTFPFLESFRSFFYNSIITLLAEEPISRNIAHLT